MVVERLQLENFRNISYADVQLDPHINVFLGKNAQGKTNFIEALWLFSALKSFRAVKETDFIRFGEEKASAILSFKAFERSQTAKMEFFKEKKKELTLNGAPLEKMSQMVGNFCAVLFSPVHLQLITEGPAGRRRFLDLALCQLSSRYLTLLTEYNRILRQRNAALKLYGGNLQKLKGLLEVWDLRLAQCGAKVMEIRSRYIKDLQQQACEIHRQLSSQKEELTLRYVSVCENVGEEEDIASVLEKRLKQKLEEQVRFGITPAGPHRDELDVRLNGRAAKLYASQGQQRSAVLSLKLAEGDLAGRKIGESPVYLLDDVMSELDETRRSFILEKLCGRQVLITCCDDRAVDSARVCSFGVENGIFSKNL